MTDMEQTTTPAELAPTTEVATTYLDALNPDRFNEQTESAESESDSGPVLDLVKVREEQSKLILEKVAPLTPEDPTVTIQLNTTLDSQLEKELLNKGYNVATSYYYTSANGKKSESHTATVSLPTKDSWSSGPRYNLGYGTDLSDLFLTPVYSRPWSHPWIRRNRLSLW